MSNSYTGKAQTIGTVIAQRVVLNRTPVTASSYTRLAQADRHFLTNPATAANLATHGRLVTPKLSAGNRRLLQAVHQSVAGSGAAVVDVWGVPLALGACEALSVHSGPEISEYPLDLLCSLTFTAGASEVPSGSKKLQRLSSMSYVRWCDVVAATDYSRGSDLKTWAEVSAGGIIVDFDSGGYERLMFEITPDVNCGLHLILGEL